MAQSRRRPRHPDQALERLLRDAENRRWRVIRAKRYYKLYCPCPEQHKTMIHMTPNRYYENHKRKQLESYRCWSEEGT